VLGGTKVPEDRILKRAAAYSVLLMACVLLIPFVLKLEKGKVTYAGIFPMLPTTISTMLPIGEKESLKPLSYQEDPNCEQNAKQQIPGGISEDIKERLGNNFIVVEKPSHLSNSAMAELIDESVDRRIRFIITDSFETKIEENQIYRMYQGNYFKGKPESEIHTKDTTSNQASTTGSNENSPDKEELENITVTDCIKSLQVNSYAYPENECFKTEITLELNKTYAYLFFEDDYNYYISLVRPKDIYDKIIVVDAGHGGYDSGTYSRDFVYHEKDMNLSMVLELKELLDKENIKVYYTRTTDRGLTLNQRVNLANDVEADLFLSFHCNANDERGVHGTEVLYNEKQNDWTRMNSKDFAAICLKEVVKEIGLEDRGLVPRSKDVYIVGEANVPVALVEVAFMSNQGDLNFLTSKEGKQKVAKGAYDAILSAYKKLGQEDKGQMAVMR